MNFKDKVREYISLSEGAGLQRYKEKKAIDGPSIKRMETSGKKLPGQGLKITAKTEEGKKLKEKKYDITGKGFVHGKLGDVLSDKDYAVAEKYADDNEPDGTSANWKKLKSKKLGEIKKRLAGK